MTQLASLPPTSSNLDAQVCESGPGSDADEGVPPSGVPAAEGGQDIGGPCSGRGDRAVKEQPVYRG